MHRGEYLKISQVEHLDQRKEGIARPLGIYTTITQLSPDRIIYHNGKGKLCLR
jgi:hypothetical protein